MGSFSVMHWLVVLVVVLLLFGPSKLASAGKGLGEGIRNFKQGLGGEEEEAGEKSDSPDAKGERSGKSSAGKSGTQSS